MPGDDERLVPCPHCGVETAIDLASIDLEHEEPVVDCAVCCRPSRVVARPLGDGETAVELLPEG